MDRIICYTAALAVPKLIFWFLKVINPNGGGAAMTNLLKNVSLRIGMEEGVGVFVAIGVITFQLTAHYLKKHYEKKLELDIKMARLSSNDEIIEYVLEKYRISTPLKVQILAKFILPIQS